MSYDMVEEDVPALVQRVGDHVIHGSNNSVVILGRDRSKDGPASVDDGLGDQKGTGTVHLIAGRKDKGGDPDFKRDSSFIYLSMKTSLDSNLNLSTHGTGQDNDVAAAVMKSDHIRLMSRKNVKITMENSKNFVFLDGDRALISIGDGSDTIEVTKDKLTLSIDGGAFMTLEKGKLVVDAQAIQVGKDAKEPLVLGNTYRTNESSMNNNVSGLLIAAGAALNSAGADKVLVALASQGAGFLVTAGGTLIQAGKAISQFESSAGQYLSETSTTK
jgi:hypothetical protein